MQKISILGEAARYDVSCASSGSARGKHHALGRGVSIGNTSAYGICHSWTDDGRCISLLKILLTNHCEYNCSYCINRRDNDIPRAAFTPQELASITIEFYKRNYIEGLFLSSGVVKDPNHTMALMIETLALLRRTYNFNGYVHVKTIPGASNDAVKEIGYLADRVSANIEFCTNESLKLLAPDKDMGSILAPMALIRDHSKESAYRQFRSQRFAPAGQSTQIIVGASDERDYDILGMSERLYKDLSLKRVYYSAYIPVNSNSNLPAVTSTPPILREHRLYQADFLLRVYRFEANELLGKSSPDLDFEVDPKCNWALLNRDLFPVEINTADYYTLIRVPGIGVLSAKRIIAARRMGKLNYEDIKKIGVVLKRAVYFILCNGKYHAPMDLPSETLKKVLADKQGKLMASPFQMRIEDLYAVRV